MTDSVKKVTRLCGGTVYLPDTVYEKVWGQIERGEVRVGHAAAREIARRIEQRGGFWDFEARKAHNSTGSETS